MTWESYRERRRRQSYSEKKGRGSKMGHEKQRRFKTGEDHSRLRMPWTLGKMIGQVRKRGK